MWTGDVIAERFVIERPAGSGGMGSVFLALDRADGRRVAIKAMSAPSEDATERFRREARVLSELSHPAIVRYLAHGETGIHGEPFLVMEWLDGEDLGDRLSRTGLTPGESIDLIRRAAEALAFAHERGVIHRDIKPSNIFLVGGAANRVKVLDFGAARRRNASQVLTQAGMMLGTLGYMAPEQAWGSPDVDARADVFALGCVLFECLTGRPAFVGHRAVAILAKIVSDEVPRVSELCPHISADLDELVAILLSKDPKARPADGNAVLALLDQLGKIQRGNALPAVARPPCLSDAERRVVSVVLAENPNAQASSVETVASTPEAKTQGLPELARRFGAKMSPVGYGLLLVLPARGTATDQAAQAASCALDLHRLRPELRIAVATGRAEMTHRLPVGPAIDRAASAIRATGIAVSEVRVAVDEMTAGLLGPRFDVHVEDGAHWVLGERDDLEVPRLLLGRPTPCVGRDAELAHLDAVLQECIADREPRAVLVTAPPGTGKTRLASEFLTRVRARGSVRCLLARGDAVAAGSSLALAQKLIRQAVGLRETDAPELQLERLRAHLASKVHPSSLDRLTELLGEITGASGPRSAPMIRTPRNDPSVALAQKQAFDEWIEVETREPLLIVLEDLQWGDVPSVTYLQEAMRRQTNRPLMVLALGRPEVCEQFPQLWDDLAGAQVLREIRLGGLAPRAAGRLVRAVLGDEVSPETTTRIIERSVGNAFYLEELIRHVAKGETELPETVLAMAEIRLDGLEPEARRVLRAASIFGEACWSGGVAALLGPTIQTAEWLEALADRELLVRTVESRFPEEREYACRHSLLRDAIHVTLTNYDRKVAHRLAATWLESMGERNASVLAHHFQEAGEADLAAKYHLRAGDMATRLCSFGEARAHYDASLASLAQLPEDDTVRRRKVDTLLRQIYATLLADTAEQNLTRAEEARALLDEIAARGELSSDDRLRLARVYYCFGRIHLLFRADPSRAMEYYRKVLPAGKEAGDDDLIGLPSSLIGTALTIQGKAREAEPLLAQAIEPLERLGDPFEWSRAVGFHGLCLILMGRYAEGVSQLDRILANAEQVRQANLLSATHLMAGTAYLLAGDWPAAHSLLRDAVGYATETGDKLYLYLIWSSLGWTRSFLGEHDEARAARATARGIADGMGGRLLIDDWYRAGDAEIAFNAGDVEAAWKLATSVVESSGAAGLLVSQGIAQRVLSDVLALRGCHDDADAHIGQSIVTFESGGLHMQAARSRLHWAWQHRRRNNWGEAEHLYAAARAQFDRFGCVYAMADTTRRWATT